MSDQEVWVRAYAAALGGKLVRVMGASGHDCARLADEAVALFRERFPVEPNRPRAEAPLGPPLGGNEPMRPF